MMGGPGNPENPLTLATAPLPVFPLALPPENLVKPLTNIVGEREEPPVTIKLNGFARRVEHDLAVVATLQMPFQPAFQVRVDFRIQVVRYLLDHVLAVHSLILA